MSEDVDENAYEDVASGDDPDSSLDADRTDAGRADVGQFEDEEVEAGEPLGSLASSVDERRQRDRDRPDDQLFSEEDVAEIDPDVVWERLDEDETPELPEGGDRDVQIVEKRTYCEQCPYFSPPPEVRCTHDGTEILELTDMDHFRVVDCPKVWENERLERL